MKTAIVALGSNLNEPKIQLEKAIFAIGQLNDVKVVNQSSFYQTKPIGYLEQEDFVNAVIEIETALSADKLLTALQEIENQFGRVRTFQNAPRTLDLDIIDFNHENYSTERLTLPHPRAHERGFVMIPLAQIKPSYRLNDGYSASELAGRLQDQGVEVLV